MDNHCHICKDPIHLYQPYYTVKTNKIVLGIATDNQLISLCPSCFHAYENFLTEQTTHENHKKNYQDMKNG